MKILTATCGTMMGLFFLYLFSTGIYNYYMDSDMFINEPPLLIALISGMISSIFVIIFSLFPNRISKWIYGGNNRKFF